MNATVGFWLIVVGYLFATTGAALLYFNAPRDVGIGRVPVRRSGDDFFERQGDEIARRATWSRRGFGLLLLGSAAQLSGVVIQWVWPFR